MATQSVEFRAATGLTITAKLFSAGSDTEVASVSATEATNRKGTYTAAYTDVAAGEYVLIAFDSTTPVASWWVRLTLTTATFQVYELIDKDGLATSTQASSIEADTQDIQSRLPTALVSGRIDASVGAMASSVITATAIASNAITSAKLATDCITSAQLASTAITEIQSGLATTANVAAVETDTQDIQSRLPAALVSGRIDASVGAMEPNTITSSVIATGAITASAIQTNAITDDKIAASAITEIQSGLATTTQLTTVEGKIDAIDGVTDKLDTTLELDGVVYRFTTNALEQAPSGGGGGGSSIMVTPVVSQTPVRVIGQNISTFIGDLSTITVGVFSGSDPVDLSGFGDLEVCVQDRSGDDLDFVAMADLTISGTDSNYVSWDPAGPSVANVVRGKWSLRKTSNKQVIAYGAWIVEDAALEDTGS